jgi:predicted acetyltransferase
VTRLAVPDIDLRPSLVDTIADFGMETMHGAGLWHLEGALDTSEQGVLEMIRVLREFADPESQLDEKWVHCDFFWITDGDPEEVIGFLAIRHTLNAFLLEEGGHIGYSIRPARRREGHASRALGLALDRSVELGIERALVTCDDDNEPSRLTIVRNGGVLEDVRNGKERYWIDLTGRGHSGR